MKNRLGRIRTTYNEEGDYDHDLYFKQQKNVYKRQIQFATRVDAITEKQFTLRPLEIGFMNSTALKDDQKFKEIKKYLMDYNKSIFERGPQPVNGEHFKKVLMESILKFMNLMMLAPDTTTKKTILDFAYHWFIRHLDPKSSRKTAKQLQNEIREIVIQKKLLPIDLVNRELILNKVNEQLHHYKIKARTMYEQLDDPKYQLENYNTHKLEFMGNNLKSESQKNKQKKWIDTVKFPKIQPLAFAIEEANLDEKKQDEENAENNNNQEAQKADQPVPQGQEIKLDAEGKPIIPQEMATTNDQPQADLDFGEPPDPDAEPEQPEDDQKKRGKLDPLLKVFILERIRQKQKAQINCEKVRQKQINKKNLISQEDFLSGEYMRQWAKQRARIKTQVSKKHQSMRGADKVLRGKQNESATFIENDIDKIKVRSIIAQCKRDLTVVQTPADKLNAEQGLSLFDRRRVKTEASHKPFSTILTDFSRKQEQNAMLLEIDSIKEKFAKYKLFAPMDKLIKGLAPPDKQQIEDEDKIFWPNSQMLSNPFIKVAKKKKKKKKK